ncbi:U11/U12 small nuclear ribonucleoprotein 48 kDa protein [Bufo gargarizans]|uniref:U11/U12 small nuclear ribonucleoprotein 48 kDa protein n=1 Tax=Bufo gargarizans TaxID=30331 RepID=UPI001CF2DDB6|nr:U11/U12 small nuclear ribonucleoprotein 48 kDa protein [Bufo gargarizans]
MEGSAAHLLQDLKDFTERCRSRLTELLQELGWEQEVAGGEQETAVCPYDSNHRMPRSSLEKHVVLCKRWKMGYSKEEADVQDTQFFYEKAKVTSVLIDKSTLSQIIKDAKNSAPAISEDKLWDKRDYSSSGAEVPLNHKRTICDLTAAERLAVYDHVLLETKKQKPSQPSASDLFEDLTAKIGQDDEQKCPKSHLEIMAEMRDYKRRRQSYRAKNVHITKKSYTEIMRDVINVHMEELSGKWHDEIHDEASSIISSSSMKRRERSRSTESRQSGGSHRDRHRSARKRERSSSPRRRRSRGRDKESRHEKDRDGDAHHSYKRRRGKE